MKVNPRAASGRLSRHGQNTRRDARVTSSDHPIECVEQRWMIELSGNAEGHRQITRTDEQHIDTRNQCDLGNVFERGRGLNLHDAEQ